MYPARRARGSAVVIPTAVAVALLTTGCGSSGAKTDSAAGTAATPAPVQPTTTEKTAARPGGTKTTASPAAKGTTTLAGSGANGTTTTGGSGAKGTTAKPASPAVKIPATRAKLGKPQTFSGDGDRSIGTIALTRSAVVRWTVSGGSFSVTDASGKLRITGKATSGQTFAAAGKYPSSKVSASGHWTLTFRSLGS